MANNEPHFADPLAKELGELIQERREGREWLQSSLAGGLKVTQATISKWESGDRYPSLENLKKLRNCELLTEDEFLRFALRDGVA